MRHLRVLAWLTWLTGTAFVIWEAYVMLTVGEDVMMPVAIIVSICFVSLLVVLGAGCGFLALDKFTNA